MQRLSSNSEDRYLDFPSTKPCFGTTTLGLGRTHRSTSKCAVWSKIFSNCAHTWKKMFAAVKQQRSEERKMRSDDNRKTIRKKKKQENQNHRQNYRNIDPFFFFFSITERLFIGLSPEEVRWWKFLSLFVSIKPFNNIFALLFPFSLCISFQASNK